jgi:hypothetical protein
MPFSLARPPGVSMMAGARPGRPLGRLGAEEDRSGLAGRWRVQRGRLERRLSQDSLVILLVLPSVP